MQFLKDGVQTVGPDRFNTLDKIYSVQKETQIFIFFVSCKYRLFSKFENSKRFDIHISVSQSSIVAI